MQRRSEWISIMSHLVPTSLPHGKQTHLQEWCMGCQQEPLPPDLASHPAQHLQPYMSQQPGVDGTSVDAKQMPSSIFTYLLAKIVHHICLLQGREVGTR